MSHSWDHVRNGVRQFRTNFQSMYPVQVLTVVKDFTVHCNNLYFLSNHVTSADTCPSRKISLHKVNLHTLNTVPIPQTEDNNYLTATRQLPLSDTSITFTDYLSQDEKGNTVQTPLPGISSMERLDNTLMLTCNGNIYISDTDKMPTLIPYKANERSRSNSPCSPMMSPIDINLPKKTIYGDPQANRVDPKLGKDTITFIRDRDLWCTDFAGNERQLTFCGNDEDPTLKCGVAEYMMQEEFHRFTGYHRCPTKNHLLYLETSEKDVEEVTVSKNSMQEPIRYPRAGKPNAQSVLKLLEFDHADGVVLHKQLWGEHQIQTQFPWIEYIVRFGWLPDGQSVWVQILSRDQKKTALLKLYPSQFTATNTNETPSSTQILWEESNPHWINVTDTFHFMRTDSLEKVEFIWSSEKGNGYRHLYHVEKWSDGRTGVRQLTEGTWPCVDRPLYVDEQRQLVYFTAKRESPLESHFYVTSYLDTGKEPVLLTRQGYSHTVSMNSPDYFVDCFSTLSDPRVILIGHIQHDDKDRIHSALLIPTLQPSSVAAEEEENEYKYDGVTPLRRRRSSDLTNLADMVPNGDIFSFHTSDGVLLYGCLYKPRHYQADTSYPTVLHIYGGPKTQLVTNEFKFPRLMRYLMSVYFGFAVVIIDSRGSTDRGLEFEAQLQLKLGQVELKDQMEGLRFLHDTRFGAGTEEGSPSVIDLKRVAISGWSYGGYLSLMGLAQYGDFFKMAIAGAPVIEWELYDAAYTERYMGLPKEQVEAYRRSSVLSYASQFPDEENRLLIAHGLIDENVHYRNTEMLVTELVKANKPHYLQVYPSEKHGLRHASVNEHFETLMFYWLTNYL
ncbi:Alpha/Beta hydrolase protein [Mucor mucedo]|uniref:Alpha/Beta hydrolase protein n=1 Tax=Mucor mucedo TaxID=29922 RepID=UPI00221EDA5A|nr:Alpha/Beta hydrolase protein [Mucor mucedo]KAI7873076.1 Alpha/Beta hydrolase protein [Mucor mucedo]